MANTVGNNTPGTPSPTPAKLTPEAVIEQIRTLRSQIGDVTPLSKAQRNQLTRRARKQPQARPGSMTVMNNDNACKNIQSGNFTW
jgi:hypothetical protein